MTARSEEQRRAKGRGRERRILEEREAEYAEKLEEKAVIVAIARRVEGGNCSRRRMTIPLSPAYRMSEKDKERERERNSRETCGESEKEGTSERVQQGTRTQSDDQGGDEEEK